MLATAGVITRAMWPRDAKLHVIDRDGAREFPLPDQEPTKAKS